MITKIGFEEIKIIWSNHLWPHRTSAIEPISWIDFDGTINMELNLGSPTFWRLTDSHNLLGVISGYKTSSRQYRSRGLWVDPKFQGLGHGRFLLNHIEQVAKAEGCKVIWTMPRLPAWGFYQKCGFVRTSETDKYEFGPHILAEKSLANQ